MSQLDTNPENGTSAAVSAKVLYFLMAFSLLAYAGALAFIVTGKHPSRTSGLTGRVPHGPAEFSDVFNDDWLKDLAAAGADGEVHVPPPPFSEGVFPCMSCHAEFEANTTPRELEMAHDQIHLRHGERGRWCFDCHNPTDRDTLRLVDGTPVPFTESYRLCGQCHGPTYRDWRAGVHGRRRGFWDGPKLYLLCAHCHDPHAPAFKPMKPLPSPVRPAFIPELKEP